MISLSHATSDRTCPSLPSCQEGRAPLEGVFDQEIQFGNRPVVNERPYVDHLFGTPTGAEGRNTLDNPLSKLVNDGSMHDEPVCCGACVPYIAEFRSNGTVDSTVEVRILVHDEGGVSAEFHRCPQHLVCRLLEKFDSHARRAGEGKLSQARITDDRSRDLGGVICRDEVDDPGRKPSLLEQLREEKCGERCKV